MPEYIEREAAIAELKEYAVRAYDIDLDCPDQFAGSKPEERYCEGLYEALERITDAVPAADVVEVVRCKDCKHRHSSEFCECREPDAFCSDGERKEAE